MVAVELPAEITASFVAEARSYLPQIAASLTRLGDRELLSEAYRFAHTIKSSAAMMGHTGLSQLAELLEADLECVLLGEEVSVAHLAQLGRCVERTGRLLDAVTGVVVDVDAVIAEEVEDRLALERASEESDTVDSQEDLDAEAAVLELIVDETFRPEPEVAPAEAKEPEPMPAVRPEVTPAAETVAQPVVESAPAVGAEEGTSPEPVEDSLTPLIDALAETVLAFGREAAVGEPDLAAHRDAVGAWLTSFEDRVGLSAQTPSVAPTQAPEPRLSPEQLRALEQEQEEREARLRAAIEAELRPRIEYDVRSRLAVQMPEPVNPFVAIAARARRPSKPSRPAQVTRPAAVSDEDAEMRDVFSLEAAEHLKRIDADAAALRASPGDKERLRSLRRSVHTLKGAAAMMGFSAVAELSHSLEDRLDVATGEGAVLSDQAIGTLLADLDRLEGLVSGSGAIEESHEAGTVPHAEPPPEGEGGLAVAVPVRLERLDQLLTLAGEASVSVSRWPAIVAEASGALGELRRTAARVETLLAALQSERHRRLEEDGHVAAVPSRPGAQTDFDALELDRYTPTDYVAHELAQISAETAAAERELTASFEGAAELAESQRRQAAEMQGRLLDVRLVPLEELSARLQRAAHGVALRRAKEVEFVFEGTDVAVDRAVLDAVADALQHLVRNAVDHGIELPATRLAARKPRAGTVSVTARQAQGEVLIEVADDGAGINPHGVLRAARAAGVDVDRIGPREALELIFRPGVTTAPGVDDLSGRGVGLDAVAEAMARVRGTVEVATEAGSGTIFQLRFPVTLAQARVLMAEVVGNPVAIPAAHVKHVTRLSEATLEQTLEGRAVLHNGQSYPLAPLAGVLGWQAEGGPPDPPLVFVEAGARRVAWTTDAVGSHTDVVVKSLGTHLRTPRGLTGASLLQDGRVALVLHVPDLIGQKSVDLPWEPRERLSGPARSRRLAGGLRVLVVDDSPTIRKLLVRMLRDLGWQPREAKDGAEALEAIRVDRPDVVLADIEMPRLDGYGLLSALRSQPATADLPVLMLTSRTAERHRSRALELGASGYLTKPYRPEEVAAALRHLGTPAVLSGVN